MNVAVLGTGTVGRTIAGKLTEIGHDVRVGSRTAGDDKVTFADAIAHGEVALQLHVRRRRASMPSRPGEGHLDGKLVIDVTNPLDVLRRRAGDVHRHHRQPRRADPACAVRRPASSSRSTRSPPR